MRLRALRVATALAVLPLILSGCDLLLAGLYPTDPFTDPFVDPGSAAEFDRGKATLVISQADEEQTVVLDQVSGSTMFGFGATVTWRNDDGWSMTISTYGPSGIPGTETWDRDIMFERMSEGELWMTDYVQSFNQCTIDLGESTEDGMSGSAECVQLRWIDGFAVPPEFGESQPYIEGQPRFNLRVTFDAKPIGDTQSS